MTINLHTSRIGAHASALMKLRAKSLQAYGIDPKELMVINTEHSLMNLPESKTQSLARISKNSRALAIETDHAIVVI